MAKAAAIFTNRLARTAMTISQATDCPLCLQPGGLPVWDGRWMRLIRPEEPLHPAFYRLVWKAHAAEFTDLDPLQRTVCMDAVALVEREMRAELGTHKINLASLGNMVPHLHWHLVARWSWDAHWPQPVWAAPQREADAARLSALRAALPALDTRLRKSLLARFAAPCSNASDSDHA